jgi:hypothetical protein
MTHLDEFTKPRNIIQSLLDKLSSPTRIVTINKGALVSLNNGSEQDCFIIHQGTVLLRRIADQLIVGNIEAPLMLGYNRYLDIGSQVYIEAITDVSFEVIPASQFYHTVREHKLWEPLLNVTMYLSSLLFHKNTILSIRDSAAIILFRLEELMAESDSVRLNTSTHDYIQQRTHLSRSGIMKHLAMLRKSGAIVMENGILMSLSSLRASKEGQKHE